MSNQILDLSRLDEQESALADKARKLRIAGTLVCIIYPAYLAITQTINTLWFGTFLSHSDHLSIELIQLGKWAMILLGCWIAIAIITSNSKAMENKFSGNYLKWNVAPLFLINYILVLGHAFLIDVVIGGATLLFLVVVFLIPTIVVNCMEWCLRKLIQCTQIVADSGYKPIIIIILCLNSGLSWIMRGIPLEVAVGLTVFITILTYFLLVFVQSLIKLHRQKIIEALTIVIVWKVNKADIYLEQLFHRIKNRMTDFCFSLIYY